MYHAAARHLAGFLLIICFSPATLPAGVVAFEDETFFPEDWLDIVVVVDDPNVGGDGPTTSTGSVLSRTSGGNSTFYRRSHHRVFSGDAIRTGGIYLADYYEPKLQGPIESLDFRIDANHNLLAETEGYDGSTGWRPILLQNDRLYWSEEVATFDGTGWVFPTLNDLAEDDFDSSPLPVEDPNFEQPDFSLDGEIVYFGYALTNSAPGDSIDEYRGVDNWEVDVNSASNTLIGDFNGDDVISAADYVLWRNVLGDLTSGPFEGGDATGNGRADTSDYDLWKMNYGRLATVPSGSSAAAVPEPVTLSLLALSLLAYFPGYRCRQPRPRSAGESTKMGHRRANT